jgi:hypothetical protein
MVHFLVNHYVQTATTNTKKPIRVNDVCRARCCRRTRNKKNAHAISITNIYFIGLDWSVQSVLSSRSIDPSESYRRGATARTRVRGGPDTVST